MDDILKDMTNAKFAYFEYRRSFIVKGLPESMTAADPHLQIFDNYICDTPIRIRSVREPQTNRWERMLQKQILESDGVLNRRGVFQIPLSEDEHAVFLTLERRELRKNRYFYTLGRSQVKIDVFLGPLWGLNIANACFDDADDVGKFPVPKISSLEISDSEFFLGNNLVDKSLEDIRAEYGKLIGNR